MYKILNTIILVLFLCGGATTVSSQVVDKVVAVVNNDVITQRELEEELAAVYEEYKGLYQGEELERVMAKARLNVLSQMIEDKLMLEEARKAGIEVSEKEIEEQLGRVKLKFENEIEFMDLLENQGIQVKDLEARYKDKIMISKIVSRDVTSKVIISPQEVNNYYYSHSDQFIEPEKVKVLSILIRPDGSSEGAWDKARGKAQMLFDMLRDGADFKELAKDYSQGLNLAGEGDMGYVSRGQMVEEIDKVIFTLALGEMSEPVKTKLGYFILKVEDKRPERVRELSEVQSEVEEIISKEKFEQRFKEWMEKLKKDAYISIR